MKHGQLTFSDLLGVWRILVSVIVCQLLGSTICLAIGLHHNWFENLWLGSAVGTLPGFLAGLAWQLQSGRETRKWVRVTCFLGFLAFALTAIALGFELPRMQDEMRRLKALPKLKSPSIDHIDVFDQYGHEKILSITDRKSIDGFTHGIADAVGHSPSHPRYSHSWYVILAGVTDLEFELHIGHRFPESVIGYFVVKSGNSTSYHGSFESKGLRSWMDHHLIGGDAVKALAPAR